jgi:hypothetical protein
VREAAALLAHVVDASDPATAAAAAAVAVKAGGGSSGSSVAAAGLGTAPAHPGGGPGGGKQGVGGGGSPTKPPAAAAAGVRLPLRHSSLPSHAGLSGSSPRSNGSYGSRASAAAAAVDGTVTPPAALLPDVVTDHTSGLAVLRTWSCECAKLWTLCELNPKTLVPCGGADRVLCLWGGGSGVVGGQG